MRRILLAALLIAPGLGLACSESPEPESDVPRYGRYEGHASAVARVVHEPDLIPEGIAFDPVTSTFFLGSFRKSKIVAVPDGGEADDFISEHQFHFQAGVGMRVDAQRRLLWACSTTAPHMRDYDPERPAEKAIFVFDIDSGEPHRVLTRPQTGPLDIFNDLTLTADGGAYVSGFFSRRIYRVAAHADEVGEFLTFPEGHAPNGIDLDADGGLLFVATGRAIAVVDAQSAEWFLLDPPPGENFEGIDGLYFYEDSLIAIQSLRGFGRESTRIARFHLSDTYDRVTGVDVLDEAHPAFEQPTTGVIDGHNFYYIANSQFTRFDDQFRLAPVEELADVLILRRPL